MFASLTDLPIILTNDELETNTEPTIIFKGLDRNGVPEVTS